MDPFPPHTTTGSFLTVGWERKRGPGPSGVVAARQPLRHVPPGWLTARRALRHVAAGGVPAVREPLPPARPHLCPRPGPLGRRWCRGPALWLIRVASRLQGSLKEAYWCLFFQPLWGGVTFWAVGSAVAHLKWGGGIAILIWGFAAIAPSWTQTGGPCRGQVTVGGGSSSKVQARASSDRVFFKPLPPSGGTSALLEPPSNIIQGVSRASLHIKGNLHTRGICDTRYFVILGPTEQNKKRSLNS